MIEDLAETFERITDTEFTHFDRITNKLHHRQDLCAMLYLDLMPMYSKELFSENLY